MENYEQATNIASSETVIDEICKHCWGRTRWMKNKLRPDKCVICGAKLINDGKNIIEGK